MSNGTTLPPVQVNVISVGNGQIMAQPPLASIYRNNQVIQVQLFGNLVFRNEGIILRREGVEPPAVPWPEGATVTLVSVTVCQINTATPIPPDDGPQLYLYDIVYSAIGETDVHTSRPVSMKDLAKDPTGVKKDDPDVGNENEP